MNKRTKRKVQRYSAARTVAKNPYRLDPGEVWVMPTQIKERDKLFVLMLWSWIRRLSGAGGATWMVACHVLYLDWKREQDPWKRGKDSVKLANGLLGMDGVPPESKRRALRDLVSRGLIDVDWRPKKSPIVRVLVRPKPCKIAAP
jgi:hypothetical protein